METFYRVYESLTSQYPISMELKHVREGIPRYRLTVLGKGMSHRGGDMEIITAEASSWQQVFAEAEKRLRSRIGEENAKNNANSSVSDGANRVSWDGGSD